MKILENKKIFFVVVLALAGCASSETKSVQVRQASALPALPHTAYISTRDLNRPASSQCPSSANSWRKENLSNLTKYANSCARLGKFQRLEEIANLIAQKYNVQPWGPYYLSIAAEGNKQLPRALWMAELAINKSPRTAMLYYQKARVHWLLGEYTKSVENYNLAIKENPKFLDAHIFLAELYYRDQNYKLAEKHFLAILSINPEQAMALAGLAETKLVLGNPVAAAELYERAVQVSPRTLSYRFKLAAIYENIRKDYSQALITYKRIKLALSQNRYPASDVPIDVNKKISHLETLVNKNKETEKRISESEQKIIEKVRK